MKQMKDYNKKSTKGFFSLLLISLVAITACTNEDDGIFLPDNQLQLKFGVNQPEARAIFTESTLPNGNPVGVKLDDSNETAYDKYTNITFTGSDDDKGQQVWTPSEAVVLGPTKATLYAYYPCTGAESIDAISVDMTAEDQTDWLYATPVENVNEDNASHAVTMNHALANINLTINRGSYVGDGNISSITVQSDAFATKGTFNAAQSVPAFTGFADTEGQPLTRSISATLGSTTDIMVVPTATEANVDFVINVDGVNYTAQAKPVQLVNGNSYLYTLTLNSTFLGVSAFSVQPWVTQQKEDDLILEKEDAGGGNTGSGPVIDATGKANGVYAVSSTGSLIDYNSADASALGVVLVAGEHKFMIAKSDATDGTNTTLYWGKNLSGKDVAGVVTNGKVNGTNDYGYLAGTSTPQLNKDFTTWTAGALSEFNGKANTAAIINGYTEHGVSMDARDMCTVLNTFNASDSHNDWYVPACGQLALMYLNMTEINAALAKIGGTALAAERYWSSSEYSSASAWSVYFNDGYVNYYGNIKDFNYRVRFVRDLQ